jgi:hypothetical protein
LNLLSDLVHAAWLVISVVAGLAFVNRIADALERIAKVVEDAQARRCCCNDDDGPEGEELDLPPECVTDVPPPPAAKVKVLN